MFRAILWLLTVVVVFDFCFFHPPHQCLGELWVGEGAWGRGQWFPPSPRAPERKRCEVHLARVRPSSWWCRPRHTPCHMA